MKELIIVGGGPATRNICFRREWKPSAGPIWLLGDQRFMYVENIILNVLPMVKVMDTIDAIGGADRGQEYCSGCVRRPAFVQPL